LHTTGSADKTGLARRLGLKPQARRVQPLPGLARLTPALFLAFLLPATGIAQNKLSLSEAVDRALTRFPAVEAARARQEEAEQALGEARAGRRPRGRLTGSAIQYQEPMVVTPIHGFGPGLFPEFDETLGQANLTVSYTLFDSGADAARIRTADAQTLAAGAALGSSEQVLARRVAAAYLTVLGQRQVLEAYGLRMKALESELSRVQQRFEVGRAARVEILRAEAALASSEAERVRLSSAMDNAERELARLMDVPVEETRADRLVPLELSGSQVSLREALVTEGIAASPAVAQARAQAAAAEAQISLTRALARPEVRAVGNYNEWTSSQAHFTGEWNAGLQLTVPLFDGGVTRSRIARAEAAHRAAQEQVRVAEVQVREDVDRAAAAAEEAEARIASLGKAVERFVEVVRVQKLLLDEGAGTQTDYLNSEADLLTARASLAEARHAATLARVDLARAAGRLTPAWLRENIR
jgi:outer membrane protein